MKTYVYAECCIQAGQVVIPQPTGRRRKSDAFVGWTLKDARVYRATVPHTAETDYLHRSAQAVIEFRR